MFSHGVEMMKIKSYYVMYNFAFCTKVRNPGLFNIC
jgi:hypothetical protein